MYCHLLSLFAFHQTVIFWDGCHDEIEIDTVAEKKNVNRYMYTLESIRYDRFCMCKKSLTQRLKKEAQMHSKLTDNFVFVLINVIILHLLELVHQCHVSKSNQITTKLYKKNTN